MEVADFRVKPFFGVVGVGRWEFDIYGDWHIDVEDQLFDNFVHGSAFVSQKII